jgi:hypothetical protein
MSQNLPVRTGEHDARSPGRDLNWEPPEEEVNCEGKVLPIFNLLDLDEYSASRLGRFIPEERALAYFR